MSKSRSIGRNSSFVSIRKPRSCNVLSDTNKHEKARTQVIDINALRAISRIVLAIQKRIDAGNNAENDSKPCPAGNPSSSKITGPNSCKDNNRGEAEGR
jgi:hypothetical protein